MAIGRAPTSNREGPSRKQDENTLQKYVQKIRNQASQLAELNESLMREGSYSRLLERRLLELDPDHPLPVTPRHLGHGVGTSSRSQQLKRAKDQGEDEDSIRKGYAAAQERLKDAAQLIRTLREALASRDNDANAAADRARKFQRETSDLRRKLEAITGTTTATATSTSITTTTNNNSCGKCTRGSKVGGPGVEKSVRFATAAGTAAEGGACVDWGGRHSQGGRYDQQLQQQEEEEEEEQQRDLYYQQRQEMKMEVGRLRLELQEQREACAAAQAEREELHATVERLRHNARDCVEGTSLGDQPEVGCATAVGNAKANAAAAAELASELAHARSSAWASRAEIEGLRRQLRRASQAGGSGSGRRCEGGCRRCGCGGGAHLCSRSNSPGRPAAVRGSGGGEAGGRGGSQPRLAAATCRQNEGRGRSRSEDGAWVREAQGREGDGRGDKLEAENEALLDYVQDLLDRIRGLEAACACLERECGESTRLAEDLQKRDMASLKEVAEAADAAGDESREEAQQMECQPAKAHAELADLQKAVETVRAEKDEMCRLYNELLKQLRTAEGKKEELETQARQTARREVAESQEIQSLREQLDQSLRRLSDVESKAAESTRHAEEESLALKNTLSRAHSRLAKLDALEADAEARAVEIQACRGEAHRLKVALSTANSRLAKLDAFESEARTQAEELKKLQKERREGDESLARERDRTQHLVGALRDMEEESAVLSAKEEQLRHLEPKVAELTSLCEQMQRRVVSLQSGEEVEASRRRAAEMLALAERQDELLEDAAVALDQLRAQCSRHEEELNRSRESSEAARNVLEPVLMGARSQLGLPRLDLAVRWRAAGGLSGGGDDSQRRRRKWRHQSAWQPSCGLERDGDEGEEVEAEVEMEDLAREAAELLLHVLAQVEVGGGHGVGHGMGGGRTGAGGASATASVARDSGLSRAPLAAPVGVSFSRSPPPATGDNPRGPLRASSLTSKGWFEGEREREETNEAEEKEDEEEGERGGTHQRRLGQRQPCAHWTDDFTPASGIFCPAAARYGTAAANCRGRRGAREGAVGGMGCCGGRRGLDDPCPSRNSTSLTQSGKTAISGFRSHGGDDGKARRGGSGGRPWAAVMIPDRDVVRRMECIRRGGAGEHGGDGLVLLEGGVRSKRRGHLEGGREPPSVRDLWMSAPIDNNHTLSRASTARTDNSLSPARLGRCGGSGGGSTKGGNRWMTPSALGSPSPGTRKIRERIREAQAALRSLRGTD